MSAPHDQPRPDARPYSEEASVRTQYRSRLKKSTDPKKTQRTMSLTAAALVALLGVVSLGQAAGQPPQSAEMSRVADTSQNDDAPGQLKRIAEAAPAPLPATDPTPDPTTAPVTAEPAVAPAPETTTAAPAPAPVEAPLAATGTAGTMPVGAPGTWTMAFADEFNGTALDTAKWSNCWFSPSCGTMNNVSTSPSNVKVADGNLVLSLSSATSGALVSTNPRGGATTGYQFTTGYVEARIKFAGDGTNIYNWPAWWTSGQSWPTDNEIDIAEPKGPMTSNYMNGAGQWQNFQPAGFWGNEWHTFGMERKASTTDIYMDGVLVKTFASDNPSTHPHYLILNTGSGRGPAAYGAASQMTVDYVRAWQ